MEVVEISIRVMAKGKQPNKSFTVEKKKFRIENGESS